MSRQALYVFLLVVALGTFANGAGAQEETPTIEQSMENMKKIGLAIERFIEDKGVMLVDLNDDDYDSCLDRLENVFGETNVNSFKRTRIDVLAPLVEFGYLDELPTDPFAPVELFVNVGNNEYLVHSPITYLYVDNEMDLIGVDWTFWSSIWSRYPTDPNATIPEGEWVLVGYAPSEDGGPAEKLFYTPDTVLLLFSHDLHSTVCEWELYP